MVYVSIIIAVCAAVLVVVLTVLAVHYKIRTHKYVSASNYSVLLDSSLVNQLFLCYLNANQLVIIKYCFISVVCYSLTQMCLKYVFHVNTKTQCLLLQMIYCIYYINNTEPCLWHTFTIVLCYSVCYDIWTCWN